MQLPRSLRAALDCCLFSLKESQVKKGIALHCNCIVFKILKSLNDDNNDNDDDDDDADSNCCGEPVQVVTEVVDHLLLSCCWPT